MKEFKSDQPVTCDQCGCVTWPGDTHGQLGGQTWCPSCIKGDWDEA